MSLAQIKREIFKRNWKKLINSTKRPDIIFCSQQYLWEMMASVEDSCRKPSTMKWKFRVSFNFVYFVNRNG